MALVHPFRALRPRPEHIEEVAAPPYDVIDTEEARALAQGKPLSFLHVIRPEIDLPEGTDEHAEAVYALGAENLSTFAAHPAFVRDETPSLYVYRLVMGEKAQTGVFGCVSVAAYDRGEIVRHEKTRPDKEDDRTRHILTQRAHAEPVMLTYRDADPIHVEIERLTQEHPLFDFTAEGVRHTIWHVDAPASLLEGFLEVDRLYVADGHHRCKAASRAAAELDAEPDDAASVFPAVLFPMSQMRILPYNRLVGRLGQPSDSFVDRLRADFELRRQAPRVPERPGEVSLYLDGVWYGLRLPPTQRPGEAARLDVARLSEFILEPYLGITDPRTDPNLSFVGGIRGPDALERAVDTGRAALAISMAATQIEELLAVSDAGELMPPKSTWFEPKLRSGLLVHLFD